jgi:hypothetical protein
VRGKEKKWTWERVQVDGIRHRMMVGSERLKLEGLDRSGNNDDKCKKIGNDCEASEAA